jgi:dynein light chain Tctex-type 1
VVDEVNAVVKECIESTIQNSSYHHNKVGQWNSNIVEQILKKLTGLNKPFKYISTCTIMQKNGAGLHVASSCFWDNSSDGKIYAFYYSILRSRYSNKVIKSPCQSSFGARIS